MVALLNLHAISSENSSSVAVIEFEYLVTQTTRLCYDYYDIKEEKWRRRALCEIQPRNGEIMVRCKDIFVSKRDDGSFWIKNIPSFLDQEDHDQLSQQIAERLDKINASRSRRHAS